MCNQGEDDEIASSMIDKLDIKKPKKAILSLKFYEKVDKPLTYISNNCNVRVNEIVEEILSKLYDEESKSFNIDIPTKVKRKDRATSLHLEVKYIKAIKNASHKLNMSNTEYINRLIYKYLEDNKILEKIK